MSGGKFNLIFCLIHIGGQDVFLYLLNYLSIPQILGLLHLNTQIRKALLTRVRIMRLLRSRIVKEYSGTLDSSLLNTNYMSIKEEWNLLFCVWIEYKSSKDETIVITDTQKKKRKINSKFF